MNDERHARILRRLRREKTGMVFAAVRQAVIALLVLAAYATTRLPPEHSDANALLQMLDLTGISFIVAAAVTVIFIIGNGAWQAIRDVEREAATIRKTSSRNDEVSTSSVRSEKGNRQ